MSFGIEKKYSLHLNGRNKVAMMHTPTCPFCHHRSDSRGTWHAGITRHEAIEIIEKAGYALCTCSKCN